MTRQVNILLLLILCLSVRASLKAQAPWCDGYHYYQNSSLGGYSSSNYVIAIEQVRIKEGSNILYNHAADGYSGGVNCGQEYRLSNPASKAFPLVTGTTYTIDASSSSAYSYYANFGLFIDLNNDKDFLDQGEYFGTWSDINNGPFKPSVLRSKDFVIPCNAKLGATRLRLVCNYNVYTMTASYGCTSCSGPPYFGETLDMSITIDKPASLNVDFFVPNTIWIKTVREFINKNQTAYLSHNWDVNNDGTYEQYGAKPNFTTKPSTWTTAGTKCIKLTSTNCLGSDSIVKYFQVNAPNTVPAADFVSSSNSISQYDLVKFFDLSTQGPWKWQWDVYDSATYASMGYYPSLSGGEVIADPSFNGSNEYTANPEFEFDVPGCYTVVLTSTNDIGPSLRKVKKCYVTVSLPNVYNLGFGNYGPEGDNYVESSTGTVSDNGGPYRNYDNNQGLGSRSYLCITPCNARKIKLHLSQIKLKDANDILRIWDGKTAGGPGTVLLGSFNSQSKPPKDLVANSGSMYILFESDANGVDSGFYGIYTSELGPPTLPTPEFTLEHSYIFQGHPQVLTNVTPNVVGVPTWEWTIDSAQVSNEKDLHAVFPNNRNYKVCLQMNSCAGKNQTCRTLYVDTVNQQTTLDFFASNTRPKIGEKVSVRFLSDAADRFEVTIFPKTYKLLNPPAGPSTYAPGYIFYNATPGDSIPILELQFDSACCYTITVNAYNHLSKTYTSKTTVRKDFICAHNYCTPIAYINTQDIGINRVTMTKAGNKVLMDKTSPSGQGSYFDYSDSVIGQIRHCQTVNLTIERNSFKDPVNFAAFADWNANGNFNDPGELIALYDSMTSGSETFTFICPSKDKVYTGITRMRIITSYHKDKINPCGPFSVGEVEDYGLWIVSDSLAPVITRLGPDTILLLNTLGTYVDPGATAFDSIQGDITSYMTVSTDIDPNYTGFYQYSYHVCDCSGNCADYTRMINVVPFIDSATIQINALKSDCVEARRDNPDYADSGAIAYIAYPFLNLSSSIVTTGHVNTRRVGDYQIKYQVMTVAGMTSTAIRNVCVRDHEPPIIYAPNDTNIQLGSIWIDPTEVHDDYDLHPTLNKEWKPTLFVNTENKLIYTVRYTAYDSSGNIADTVYRNYKVDDFIPPVINLNTQDVVYHDVRTAYHSVPVDVLDNYYGPDKTVVTRVFSNINENLIGTYKEIFEAVDGSGNTVRKTRTVKVVDRVAPHIWGPSLKGCVGDVVWPLWGLNVSDNYYTFTELKPLIQVVSQNINIWEEGIYQITLRVTDPSGNRSEDFVRYIQYTYPPSCSNSTDIGQMPEAEKTFRLYPNPSSSVFTIELNSADLLGTVIRIMDMTGNVVKEMIAGSTQIEVDMSGYSAGIYMVELKSADAIIRKPIAITR